MRPVHFNDLSARDKALLLEDMGVLLCSIEHYDHRVYLYALNSLFIEVYQNIETRIIERIAVASDADLDKFLSQITIDRVARSRKTPPVL